MRLILCLLALSGCAAVVQVGPAAQDDEPTVIGQGTDPDAEIYVYRAAQAGFVGNVVSAPEVTLNGQVVGTCSHGRPLVLRVPSGTHQVAAADTIINAQPAENEPVYLRCGVKGAPSLSPTGTLVEVDATTAAREASL